MGRVLEVVALSCHDFHRLFQKMELQSCNLHFENREEGNNDTQVTSRPALLPRGAQGSHADPSARWQR